MTIIVGPTLPEPYNERVKSIWDELVGEFDVDRFVNPFPHFTLYGLDGDADVATVEAAVRDAVADHEPFVVSTDGVGVFPGNHVWIPVARSPLVTDLHGDVVRAVSDCGTAPTPYYDPTRWIPHVGLALGLDTERAGDVVNHLLEVHDFDWEFTVDNVEITRQPSKGAEYERVASVDL